MCPCVYKAGFTFHPGLVTCQASSSFLCVLFYIGVCVLSVVSDCDSVDCNPPGSSTHGVF